MTDSLAQAGWSIHRVGEALVALARAANLPLRTGDVHPTRSDAADVDFADLVGRTADWLGLEAEHVATSYAGLTALVRGSAPAILRIDSEGAGPRIVLLLRSGRKWATVLTPTGPLRVAADALVRALGEAREGAVSAQVDRILQRTGVSGARATRARQHLLRERIGDKHVAGCWVLRSPARSTFVRQLLRAGASRDAVTLALAHGAQYALTILAWWAIGRGALQGHLDRGWLAAWALLLVSQVIFRALEFRAQGRLTVDAAALLKRRLFQGTLSMEPEEIRSEGAGQLLGRTLEAAALETLAISGGLTAAMAVVDLLASGVLLALGPGGALRILGFLAFVAVALTVGRGYWSERHEWTRQRLSLTHDLVERMVGNRTRLAQLGEEERHAGEDVALAEYHGSSRRLDRGTVVLTTMLPAGWLIFGLASLVPSIATDSTTPTDLAITLGALLLSVRAMQRVGVGGVSVAAAVVAWGRVKSLFDAGARFEQGAAPGIVADLDAGKNAGKETRQPERPVLAAQDVVFRYRAGGEPVLRGCSLRIAAHDRVLLEGPSGGGKSTLALLLAGVRVPGSGTLLVDGLDRQTLGPIEWRRRVVAVPQFHENHVISSTFAFNLLMGRDWPPRAKDLAEAEALCRELDLGDLLERMPSGLQQMVGDTGWQLSHGERSRVYLARALLQSPEVLVLDESFAALDPETMRTALECVLRRAPAVVVVAHP